MVHKLFLTTCKLLLICFWTCSALVVPVLGFLCCAIFVTIGMFFILCGIISIVGIIILLPLGHAFLELAYFTMEVLFYPSFAFRNIKNDFNTILKLWDRTLFASI